MTRDDVMVTMGVSLYERQLPALEDVEQERGLLGRSAVLRQIVDEYLEQRQILRLVEARRQGLITHEEALNKFSALLERDGDGQ